MEQIAVDREFDASAERLRSLLSDVTGVFEAAGFDVARDGDRLALKKQVAMAQFELDVRLDEDDSVALSYEQVSGPFAAMEARYAIETVGDGSRLTIETSFEPPATGVGAFLNAAAVRRQRRRELDTVESLVEGDVDPSGSETDARSASTRGD